LNKHTNLDIKDAACLHIVQILQYPTSCPTTKSIQTTIVNALKKNFSPHPVGKYRDPPTDPHNIIIKRIKAIAAWKVTKSEP